MLFPKFAIELWVSMCMYITFFDTMCMCAEVSQQNLVTWLWLVWICYIGVLDVGLQLVVALDFWMEHRNLAFGGLNLSFGLLLLISICLALWIKQHSHAFLGVSLWCQGFRSNVMGVQSFVIFDIWFVFVFYSSLL